MTLKICAVIPARMASSRFPGKPLAPILGIPMIEHVRRRAGVNETIDEVFVATCDKEIYNVVTAHGGQCIMTANTHERCTDRVQEAMASIDADVVVIIQGDEPLFDPAIIDPLVLPFQRNEVDTCVNLLSTITDDVDLQNQDVVKAVITTSRNLMFLSRSCIPYFRVANGATCYRQTGISCFSKTFLKQYTSMHPTPLEVAESVDFLRILEHGFRIKAHIIDEHTVGVDRAEHVALVEQEIHANSYQLKLHKQINNEKESIGCTPVV